MMVSPTCGRSLWNNGTTLLQHLSSSLMYSIYLAVRLSGMLLDCTIRHVKHGTLPLAWLAIGEDKLILRTA